jgi:hypothetical protein
MADQTQSSNPAPSQQASSQQAPGTSTAPANTSPLCEVEVANSPISVHDLQQHIQSLALVLGRGSPHTHYPNIIAAPIQMRPTAPSINPLQYNNPIPSAAQRDVQNTLQLDAPSPTRTTAFDGAAPVVTKHAPTQSQSSEEPRPLPKAERIEKSIPPPDKPSPYGWGATKQEAAANPASTQPKEQATPQSSEHSLLSMRTQTQALEKALESMLQGISPDPSRTLLDRPLIREVQVSQSAMPDVAREQLGSTDRAGTGNAVVTHGPEQVPRDTSTPNQPSLEKRVHADLTATGPEHSSLQQRGEQRSEQIRVLQQIVAAELEPPIKHSHSSISDALRTTLDSTPSLHPRHESTTVSVQTLRDGLLSKFDAIQSQIQTSSTERQSLQQSSYVPHASGIQGRSDFLKANPIHHDAAPTNNIHLVDRSGSASSVSKIFTDAHRTLSALIAPGASILERNTPVQAHVDTRILGTDSLDRLIDVLKKFSKRSTNFELMKRMDSTLEQTCLSLVTVVALGVVGIEVMMRLAHAALAALLKELRDTQQKESAQSQADEQLQAELEAELDTYLSDILEKDDTINSVVDVSGIIISSETGDPLPGILIGSRELGSTVSDGDGSFIFRNILYGVSYSLNLYKGAFQVSPNAVKGVSGAASMHHIEVTLTPIKPR